MFGEVLRVIILSYRLLTWRSGAYQEWTEENALALGSSSWLGSYSETYFFLTCPRVGRLPLVYTMPNLFTHSVSGQHRHLQEVFPDFHFLPQTRLEALVNTYHMPYVLASW